MLQVSTLNKAIRLVLPLLLFALTIQAQTFQKTYGGSSEEYIYAIEQLSDGGYIMCGRSITGTINSSWDSQVIRLNANGDTVWTKNYGNVGYDEFQSVKPTADGGFILTGQTDVVDALGDVHLVKLDANGTVTWSQAYGAAGTADYGYSVCQTADGGYIIAGLTASVGAGGRDMLLIKTNSAGVVTWSKSYGGTLDDEARCVEQTADGGYIVSGYTLSYGSNAQGYLIKTNSTGVVTWSKTFGGSNTEVAYSVKQLTDGSYILAGYTDSYGAGNFDFMLIKLTSAGATTWNKTYGGSSEDRALSVKITSDGGYILGGKTLSYGGGNSDYFLVKTDGTGTLTWAKAYGGTALDQAYGVTQTADGGYALTGYANSYGSGSKDGYLVKTDANGTSGCSEVTASPTTGNTAITVSTGATESAGISAVTPTTAKRKTTMAVGTQCFTSGVVCTVDATFTSSATTVCAGTTVTFTNTSTNATNYKWKENGVQFATTTNATRTFNTAGSFIIRLVASDANCSDSTTTTITVNALPTATITPGGNTTFCQGGSVTLTASAGTSYLWSPGGATTQSITATTGGSYTVTVSNGTCSATSAATVVTVNPLPTATITPSGSTTFCQGGSVTLTGSAGTSWLWSPGGATTQSINVTTGGNYTVTVSNGTCSATSSVTTVTVGSPTATITPSGSTTFCQGGSVTLTANAGTSYLWSPGGQTTQSINVTTGGNYTVTVSNGNNCTATSSITTVTVGTATATITPSGTTTFCQGGSVTLTANTGTSYLWSPGGATTQSINVTTGGNYTVTVNNANTCSATSSVTAVTVNPLPTATITPNGPTTFCQGTFNFVTLNANSATNWLWIPGGQTTQSITVNTSGNYSVIISNGFGCKDTSDITTVTVNPLPIPPIITLNNGVLQSSYPTGNQWFLLNNIPVLGLEQTFTPTQDGFYQVAYTDPNGCISFSDSVYVDVTGLTELTAMGIVSIYPNPATEQITISATTKNVGLTYTIFDQLGRTVLSGKLTGENTIIGLSELAVGPYVLTLNGATRQSFKVMKQ